MAALESRADSTVSVESDRSSLRNDLQCRPEPTSPMDNFMQEDCDNVEDVTCTYTSVDYSSMLEFELDPIDMSMMQGFTGEYRVRSLINEYVLTIF